MKQLAPAPANLRAEWRAEEERRLSPAEFEARVAAPMTDVERADLEGLIAWFCRRYPSPAARLAYHRRHELARRRQRAATPTVTPADPGRGR